MMQLARVSISQLECNEGDPGKTLMSLPDLLEISFLHCTEELYIGEYVTDCVKGNLA